MHARVREGACAQQLPAEEEEEEEEEVVHMSQLFYPLSLMQACRVWG